MDPEANLAEQEALAVRIIGLIDNNSNCDGDVDAAVAEEIINLSSQLSDLVVAYANWRHQQAGHNPRGAHGH